MNKTLGFVAVLVIAACGGSGGSGGSGPPNDPGPFVPQSVFLGSCLDVGGECTSFRQNSGFELDVRSLFEQTCVGGGKAYSSGPCSSAQAGCCLFPSPSSEAGAVTKLLICEATLEDVDAFNTGCTMGDGTPSSSPPSL